MHSIVEKIPMTYFYYVLLITCTAIQIIMEYFSFYTNMDEYLAVALTDENQYYSTTDRLIDEELFTVDEKTTFLRAHKI